MTPRRWAVAGLVFLAGAVVAITYSRSEGQRYWYVALRAPFAIIEGRSFLRPFQLTSTADYDLALEFQRALPYATLDDMLAPKSSPIRVQWRVLEDGHTVAQGTAGEARGTSWDRTTAAQLLGRFSGQAGHTHELQADSLATVPQLQGSSPVLQVVRDPIPFKYHFVRAQLSAMGALALTAGAVICAATGALQAWLRRRARLRAAA